jgi:ribosomal protein L37E
MDIFSSKEMEMYEKCPRCGSLSCTTELSTDDRKTKCGSCGFEGNVTKFREHKGFELPKTDKPVDLLGRKMQDPEEESRKIELLKRLDIQL